MTKANLSSVKFVLLTIFSAFFTICLNVSDANAAIGDMVIVCGKTANGQAVNCDTATHKCYDCEHHTHPKGFRWLGDRETHVFTCLNKGVKKPSNCTASNKGGLEGESHTQVLFWETAKDEGVECITNNFLAMYTSSCYSCEIIETLASAFIKAAAQAYDVSREAGNAILVVGMIIWVAIFVLKNISSFTTAEPRKMIQDLLLQLFYHSMRLTLL